MAETHTFLFNGHEATVIVPEHPNSEWIWKTEFLYAFDQAEKRFRMKAIRAYIIR